MHNIEQERRNFKAEHPELYEYIRNLECAKVLDMAGDLASGFDHGAANRLWQMSGRHRREAEYARGEL